MKRIPLVPLAERLDTFWFTFPQDSNLPLGLGVTAFSEADARQLLVACGVAEWFVGAREIRVRKGVGFHDIERHLHCNTGPLQFRGVWYPCMNIGFGAPRV